MNFLSHIPPSACPKSWQSSRHRIKHANAGGFFQK